MFDFETYWDDSGTHEGAAIAVAACYVATSEQWKEFVRNWDEARSEEGFDVFHMADFMAKAELGIKPYCDWSREKKRHVYFRLASIINARARFGWIFGVPVAAFNRHAPDRFRKELSSDPFIFAVQTVLALIAEWRARYAAGKAVQYVFEDRRGMAKIRQLWELFKEWPEGAEMCGTLPNSPDGLTFQSPRVIKPLQAADILAWNGHAHLRGQIAHDPKEKPPSAKPYLDVLWDRRPLRVGLMTEIQVKEAFEKFQKEEEEKGKRPYLLPSRMLKALAKAADKK